MIEWLQLNFASCVVHAYFIHDTVCFVEMFKIRPAGRVRRCPKSYGSGQEVFGDHVSRRVNLARQGPREVT